ncbi:hypothetical protein D3C85_837740 [compost metagenome]
MVHAHLADLAVQLVLHVIAHQLLTGVGDGFAASLGGGVGVTGLHVLLHLVAGITATHRPCDGRDLLAGAAADLVAQQATRYRAQHGAGDLMLVLDRTLAGHRHIIANLARRLDGFTDRLDSEHFGIFRAFAAYQVVGGHGAAGSHTNRTQNSTDEHRLVHMNLLIRFLSGHTCPTPCLG